MCLLSTSEPFFVNEKSGKWAFHRVQQRLSVAAAVCHLWESRHMWHISKLVELNWIENWELPQELSASVNWFFLYAVSYWRESSPSSSPTSSVRRKTIFNENGWRTDTFHTVDNFLWIAPFCVFVVGCILHICDSGIVSFFHSFSIHN